MQIIEKIVYEIYKDGASILRAVNNKRRHKIINLLLIKGRLTVTELYVQLRLRQSMASQHLAILRRAGIVKTERDGKFIYYSLNYNKLEDIENACKAIIY